MNFSSGSYRKNGSWQKLARGIWTVCVVEDVPAEVIAQFAEWLKDAPVRAADTRRRDADQAQLEASEIDAIVNAYVRGTNPRMFVLEGHDNFLDAGEATLIFADRFGWHGTSATWYVNLNQTLVDAGFRVREFSSHRFHARDGNGSAHVPRSLESTPVL
jgi:hypothetical protein